VSPTSTLNLWSFIFAGAVGEDFSAVARGQVTEILPDLKYRVTLTIEVIHMQRRPAHVAGFFMLLYAHERRGNFIRI
jgi:hypothetical protein